MKIINKKHISLFMLILIITIGLFAKSLNADNKIEVNISNFDELTQAITEANNNDDQYVFNITDDIYFTNVIEMKYSNIEITSDKTVSFKRGSVQYLV